MAICPSDLGAELQPQLGWFDSTSRLNKMLE